MSSDTPSAGFIAYEEEQRKSHAALLASVVNKSEWSPDYAGPLSSVKAPGDVGKMADDIFKAVEAFVAKRIEKSECDLADLIRKHLAVLDRSVKLEHQVERHSQHLGRLQTQNTRHQAEIAALKADVAALERKR